jgi:hypothetical protein
MLHLYGPIGDLLFRYRFAGMQQRHLTVDLQCRGDFIAALMSRDGGIAEHFDDPVDFIGRLS